MISFNAILLFALFSVCAGMRQKSPLVNDIINYTHANQEETWMKAENVYAFTAKDIEGNDVPLSNYRGKVLIIVNVASKCGLTGINYRKLIALYTRYAIKGLMILAFPCNQFLNQEPGTNEEIAAFAKEIGVKFPMFSKINVNGDDASPLWKYLKLKKKDNENISMSFTKFFVDRNGHVVKRISPLSDVDLNDYIRNYGGMTICDINEIYYFVRNI